MVKKQTKSHKTAVSRKPVHRTAPVRRARTHVSALSSSDSTFFLKLVMFVVLGSFWLKFANPVAIGPLMLTGMPIGLMLGVLFASHDRFQIDRKIEYAILIIMAVLTYFVPAGIVI